MRTRSLLALSLVAAVVSSALPVGDALAVDIPGVVYNPGTDTYYKLYTSSLSWAQAKQAAITLGGHLVTITSASENSFVQTNLGLTTDVWIGATDEVTEGTWAWVTGETWSYTNWNSGEPNDVGGEDYCSIRTDGKWNDLPTSVTRMYIVEWEEDPNGPPEAPSNLRATGVTEERVDLAWNDNSTRESTYEVERAEGAGGFEKIATLGANTTTHGDTSLTVETEYSYRVRANGSGGPSDYTNVVTVVTPSPPVQDLVATPLSSTSVELEWTDVASLETGYRVERGDGASATVFSTLTNLPANSTGYTDSAATAETTYTYRLRSLGPDGTPSSPVTAVITTFPGPPGYLAVGTPDGPNVLVEWTDSSTTKTGFEIERRRTSPVTAWTPLASVGALFRQYEDATAAPETEYGYRIRVQTTLGTSEWSDEKRTVTPPFAPSDVVATPLSTNHVRLSWTDNARLEQSFTILRAVAPDGTFTQLATVPRNGTSYDDETVSQEGVYLYRIAAVGATGRSAWADTAQPASTPAALTISSVVIKAAKAKGRKPKPAQLDVRGAFDVGVNQVLLDGATSIEVGAAVIAIPSLTRSKKAITYAADGVQLSLFPDSGSSRVGFALRLSGDPVDALPPDGDLRLRYTRGDFSAQGVVRLQSGRYAPARSGHVVEPPLDVSALSVRLTSGIKDRLKAKGVFDTSGGVPDTAPDVSVNLGLLSFRTLLTGFTRKGDVWTYQEKDGASNRKLVLDYAKGQFSISLTNVDVGELGSGRVPVTMSFRIDGARYEDSPVFTAGGSSVGY